jgi:hypothetical protein
MWEKPYISIFIEIGALRNFTHFDGHLWQGELKTSHHHKATTIFSK